MKTNTTRRTRQISDQIRYELGWLIDRKIKDPARGFITVTRVRLSPDLRHADVYYTVLGEIEDKERAASVLSRAKDFLRREIGQRVHIRYVPELKFHYDDSLDHAQRINSLLDRIHDQADRHEEDNN